MLNFDLNLYPSSHRIDPTTPTRQSNVIRSTLKLPAHKFRESRIPLVHEVVRIERHGVKEKAAKLFEYGGVGRPITPVMMMRPVIDIPRK